MKTLPLSLFFFVSSLLLAQEAKIPKTPKQFDLKADSSVYEPDKNQVVCAGNIRANDGSYTLSCDNMLIELDISSAKPASTDDAANAEKKKKSIKTITCSGKLKVLDSLRTLTAEKGIYDYKNGKITMRENCVINNNDGTGQIKTPWLIIYKDSKDLETGAIIIDSLTTTKDKAAKLQKKALNDTPFRVSADASKLSSKDNQFVFTGNIKLDDGSFKLTCEKMIIHFKKTEEKKAKLISPTETAESNLELKQDKIAYIEFIDKVIIKSDKKIASSKKAIYTISNGNIKMTGDCTVSNADGSGKISTDWYLINKDTKHTKTGKIHISSLDGLLLPKKNDSKEQK